MTHKSGLITSVEGMRAIAVLAVLMFHLDMSVAQGGFLGVDVFFVISGFIITRNILRQKERETFTLSSFYYARFRRLIPALAVVTLGTLLAAVPLLPPSDLEAAGRSALFAILSASNFLFWWQADYFDAAASTKPLLHTWSLGVEEQFYLFWPLLLLLVRRWGILSIACAVLGLASVIGAAILVTDHSSAVFFLSPFRVYQFMLGAIIATCGWSLTGRLGSCIQLLGLAGLITAMGTLSAESPPLLAGGAAALASFFLLLSRDARLATAFTGHRALQWLGQRSYALYLVHWPTVVLYKYWSGPELDRLEQVLLGVGSLIGAMLLHRFIEQPFRKSAGVDVGRVARAATPVTVLLLLIGMFTAANLWGMRGFPDRQSGEIQATVAQAANDSTQRKYDARTGTCHAGSGFTLDRYDESKCAPFIRGRVNVLVIGDSVAADAFLILKQAYPQVVFSQATGGSCQAFAGRSNYSGCKAMNDFRFDVLAKRDYDYVVLAGMWRDSNADLIAKNVALIRGFGRKVVVVGPGIEFKEDVVRTLSMASSINDAKQKITAGENRKTELGARIRGSIGDAGYVDLGKAQCPLECETLYQGALLYVDKFHISPHGTRRFARRLARLQPALFGQVGNKPAG